MKKMLHIGLPKTGSTHIQRQLLAKCEEIYHLGVAVEGDDIGYVNSKVGSFIEHDLMRSRAEYFWAGSHVKGRMLLDEQAQVADSVGAKWMTLSEEHFGMILDRSRPSRREVFRRLSHVLGRVDEVLFVWRDPMSLLDSWYRESIRLGNYGTSEEFYRWVWETRFSGFLVDLDMNLLLADVTAHFGVKAWVIDYDVVTSGQIRKVIEEKLCVRFPSENERVNDALSVDVLFEKRKINESMRHDLGRKHYSHFQWHRLRDWIFECGLGIETNEEEVFGDVLLKRASIEQAQASASRNNPNQQLIEDGFFRREVDRFLNS